MLPVIPHRRKIVFRETTVIRHYLRTGSCPEGRLTHTETSMRRISVPFGTLQSLSREYGYARAVRIALSAERSKRRG